ncbi:hypothetical protein LCGC14_1218880 [marine sediment metagenome]|uniref:Uncharacterized protein n=1 Tax=marine sediment metagenome TaxID=412755 RepID=A0A0F9NU60_9ZZZZ
MTCVDITNHKILLIPAAFLVISCRPAAIDITHLTADDQIIAKQAAEMEGRDTSDDVIVVLGGDWEIRYDFDLPTAGHAYPIEASGIDPHSCLIKLNPEKLSACPVGGMDEAKLILIRHEIRHCEGEEHSDDITDLMFPVIICSEE